MQGAGVNRAIDPGLSSTALAGEGDREAVEGAKPGSERGTKAPSVSPRAAAIHLPR